jgi:uncharacterized protein (TIGR02246 family)
VEKKMSSQNKDIEAINKIIEEYVAGYNTGDLQRVMDLWVDDAVVMPHGEPTVLGKKAVEKWKAQYFDQYVFNLQSTSEELQVGGDWAFNRGSYLVAMTPKNGGSPVHEAGKFIQLFQRQEDGSWKVARDMGNTTPI